MYKKALAILLICAVFLSMGCARKGGDITPSPTAIPSPSVSTAPFATPGVSPSPAAGWTYIDPSIVDVSEDEDDSIPEFSMPTPGPD